MCSRRGAVAADETHEHAEHVNMCENGMVAGKASGVHLEAQVQQLVLGQVIRHDLRGADADVPHQVGKVACAQGGAGGVGPGTLGWQAEQGALPSPALAKRQVDLCSSTALLYL